MFSASFLPSILLPLATLGVAAVGMAFLFIYIEREDPTGL